MNHKTPFEDIQVTRNSEELNREFIDKWVVPFYMSNLSGEEETKIKLFAEAARKINIDIVRKLLGDLNWRTRITAAYFAAIKNFYELEEDIGKHLLKSEVCYAGRGYCLALAVFASNNSKEYLQKYLDYYLDRKDLWYDQAEAYCALEYLDRDLTDKLADKWNYFVSDKENWNLERSRERFLLSMSIIEKIREIAND